MGKKHVQAAVVAGFFVASGFNACSPVKFAASTDDPTQKLCTASALENCSQKEKTIVVRAPTSEVDVLVIVDDSDSMDTEREKLGERMKTFTDRLTGLDWRLCVTTTSPKAGMQGELYKFTNNQYVLTSSSPNTNVDVDQDGVKDFNDVFLETLLDVETTSGNEQGIAAAGYTIANKTHSCFRDTAALAAVLLSDEDEASAGGWNDTKSSDQWRALNSDNKPQFVFDALYSRFKDDQKIFTFNSIVIRSSDDIVAGTTKTCSAYQLEQGYEVFYGRRYEDMSQQSGGLVGNICADNYGAELTGFADQIKKTLQAVTLDCAPVGSPQVTVSTGAQPYAVLGNKIVFNNPVAAGTVVTVKYYCGQ